ncbi:MAG: tetratricopeptide repeat protein, partial [Acidobacteriota bacterium]
MSGQFLHIVVKQLGIDVVVTLYDQNGTPLVEVNSPDDTQEPEQILLITKTDGSYRLQVRSLNSGRYEVRIAELRKAEPDDEGRIEKSIAAQLAYEEGKLLLKKATGEGEQLRSEEKGNLLMVTIGKFTTSLGQWQKIGNRYGEAYALSYRSIIYYLFGNTQEALCSLNIALSLFEELGDRYGEGSTLLLLSQIYYKTKNTQMALEYSQRAQALLKSVGDHIGEVTALNNIGVCYGELGKFEDKQKAQEYLREALRLSEEVGYHKGKASSLNNLGAVYDSLGEEQNALNNFNEALNIYQKLGSQSGKLEVLNNIGKVYYTLRDKRAFENFKQALELSQELGDKTNEASILSNLCGLYNIIGKSRDITPNYCNRALELHKTNKDSSGEAYAANNTGRFYQLSGDKQKALDYYHQALSLFQGVGNLYGEAAVLNNISRIYYFYGEAQKALGYCNRALSLQEIVGDKTGQALTLSDIAVIKRDCGDLDEALKQIKKSIEILESLQTKIDVQELRTSYFVSVQDRYDFYIDLLMRLHKQAPSNNYAALALEASEQARARTLLEIIKDARIDFRQGVPQELLDRERNLKQQLHVIANKRLRLMKYLDHKDNREAELEDINKEIERLTDELQRVEAQICKDNPRCQAVKDQESLTLANIQKEALDTDTLLLEYALGKERSYLWLVTSSSIESFELPSREEIEKVALQFYQLLTARERKDFEDEENEMLWERVKEADSNYPQVAAKLSNILLGPITNQLGNKRLLIVG